MEEWVGQQWHRFIHRAASRQHAHAATGRLETEALSLPPTVAVFDDAALNRALYLWLAAQGACIEPTGDWLARLVPDQGRQHDALLQLRAAAAALQDAEDGA